MGQFEAAVRGLSDACRAFEIPVVSGNVSFYNETDARAIPPTPTVGMVGLLEDVGKRVRLSFQRNGDVVALFGVSREELGGSEFLRTIRGRDEGPCPEIDLADERRLVDLLIGLAEKGLLDSAHDVSDGGLAVALAECAMRRGIGAEISLEDSGIRVSALLFGESTGRAVVSFPPEAQAAVAGAAKTAGVSMARIGRVGGDRLAISVGDRPVINEAVAALAEMWKTSFAAAMEAGDVL
jgi:phosphoribosylformylglycinamidine synthase